MANIPIFDACTLFGPWPQHPADLALETLLQVMQRNGIVRSLVTATTGIFYDYRRGNSETLEAAKKYPQQLFPVATLDPRSYPYCLDEAKARAAEGFRLFRFFPSRQGWPFHYGPFQELLQICDDLKVPVAVEISRPGDCTAIADAVAFTQAPLLLAGVTSPLLGEALSILRRDPKFHIETTHLLAPHALETICETVDSGVDRLIFASHSPLRYLSAALMPVMNSSLSEEQKTLVLGGNLKRLLTNK